MDEVRVTTIAIVFAIVLLGLRHRSGVLNNFSDFFFSLGTVLIVVGEPVTYEMLVCLRLFPIWHIKSAGGTVSAETERCVP